MSAMEWLTLLYVVVTGGLLGMNWRAVRLTEAIVSANRGMAEEMQSSRLAQARGVFEAAFFQLVGLHNELVDKINLGSGYVGQAAFGELYRLLEQWHLDIKRENRGLPEADIVQLAYEKFFLDGQKHVGHYFRSLYNIVKFIDSSELPQEEKQKYVNLLRARLSSTELLLLFYNCQTHLGREQFVPLIVKYALLEGIPVKKLFAEEHRGLYPASAFQEAKAN